VIVNAPRNARNTDGINPGNSTDVTITRSFIHAGDDNVAIKAPKGGPTAHMTIAHNHFYAGHGMSIGSETDGGASAQALELVPLPSFSKLSLRKNPLALHGRFGFVPHAAGPWSLSNDSAP
jgi:hypothetical protein